MKGHIDRKDTYDLLHRIFGPAELGDNLVAGLGGQIWMGPGMNADLVAGHVFVLEHLGSRDGAGSDNEEGRL